MLKTISATFVLMLALAAPAIASADAGVDPARAADPTIHQIYAAADSGKLSEADAMIARVLRAHPSSAKAHFVHAELLVKEGQLAAARSELDQARVLAPDLPFAKPEAVAGLVRALEPLSAPRASLQSAFSGAATPTPAAATPSILPTALTVLALVVAGIVLLRSLMRRNAPGRSPTWGGNAAAPSYAGYGPGFGSAQPPQPMAAAPVGGGGMGLGGALATGAAMGLGAVAVEEAVRHFAGGTGGYGDRQGFFGRDDAGVGRYDRDPAFANNLGPDTNADMGGNDFGISDASSWDSGGGGDDNSW